MSSGDKANIDAYANVVSAETSLIGCAAANYQLSGYSGTLVYVTCNYGPRMKATGAIYKRGTAGSACPAGTKKEADTGLCAALPEATVDYCNVATCIWRARKTALCGNAVSRLLFNAQWFSMVLFIVDFIFQSFSRIFQFGVPFVETIPIHRLFFLKTNKTL